VHSLLDEDHLHHVERVLHVVLVVKGQGFAMQVWLPRYHWQATSLSQDTESLHWHGGRTQDVVVLFQMQPSATQEASVVWMHRRGPQDDVLEYHSHSPSALQLSRVP
jgi:hypothetical protein